MRSEQPLIPSRLKVGVLGCIGCTLLYLLRSNLSVTIIAMVDEKALIEEQEVNGTDDLCYDVWKYNKTKESGYHVSFACSFHASFDQY